MPDPVFGEQDRVETPGGPPNIANMTPQQVAQYYQGRERQLVANAEAAIATAGAGRQETPRQHTTEDFEADPLGTVRDLISREGVTRNEFTQMTQAAQATLIAAAKNQASQNKKYWTRLSAAIDQITAGADPMAKLDASFWETAYHAALGQNLSTIQAEEAAEAEATRISLEAPSGGAIPPEAPRALTLKETAICDGLGITQDQFRRGEKNIRDNVFPVTLDNRRR